MRRRKAKQIHGNALLPADASLITGVRAVAERIDDLLGSYQRIKGNRLDAPPELQQDAIRFNQLVARFQTGDFRYTESELRSMKTIAAWSLIVNADLRNQERPKVRL